MKKIYLIIISVFFIQSLLFGWAIDCQIKKTKENFIGVRYKAFLVEHELSETMWMLIFAGSGFTGKGEYQPHFIDLMIKGGGMIHDDELCANGFPAPKNILDNFTLEIGLSDYEDEFVSRDNDIGMWCHNSSLFPRRFTNIDSSNPEAPDKIMAEYQSNIGGSLEGREIEVSLERGEETSLSRDINFYMDPDNGCLKKSQADIIYRKWIVTFKVPSLGIESSIDIYVNASQAEYLLGENILNLMWENPRRAFIESDKYKVIFYDMETKNTNSEWKRAEEFVVDWRVYEDELPQNSDGKLLGGFRKVFFKGRPAIEASFGYGYTDYVIDGNPFGGESNENSKGVIDLRYNPLLNKISGRIKTNTNDVISAIPINVSTDEAKAITDSSGYYEIQIDFSWSGSIAPLKAGYTFNPANRIYTNVISKQENQDYIATPVTSTISGSVKTSGGAAIAEVAVTFSDGGAATTDASGKYSKTISYGWSGIAIPKKDGYYFTPSARSYGLVVSNQTDQDYIGTALTNDDMAQLRYHLNIIATTDGWVQSSVDKANSILSKTIYSASHWETFFTDYFLQNYFTDNLRNYIGYPIFWWFGNDIHLALQTGLINPLIQKIKNIMSSSSTNLGQVLENNSFLRQTIFNCHRFFNDLANYGVIQEELRNTIYNFYAFQINLDYPHIFKSSITLDPNTQPYVPTVKAFNWMVMLDLYPLKNQEIENIIGLSGRLKKIWNDLSILIMDNNGLDDVQLDSIYKFFSKIPRGLPVPRKITVNDFLGNTGSRNMYDVCKIGINIFGCKVGQCPSDDFPPDVLRKISDGFSIGVAHEANHVIDGNYVYGKGNERLKQRKEELVQRAGTEHMNYLRSMFDDGFFMNAPQEFIASIANEWFSDSAHTLELGIVRFNSGYREPINQALFFADIYSLNTNKTVFYTIDTSANIEKNEVPIGRKNGNINLIVWDKKAYEFALDDAGYVTGINTKNGVAISGRIKNWEGVGLEGATIAFSNNGGSITTDSNGYYTHVLNIGWSGTATASKEGYTFSPGFRSYDNIIENQWSQDFVETNIIPVTIRLDSPNGGENWIEGSSHNVTWTSAGNIANVKIELSTDNGASWSTIIASTPNTGSFSWTVPNTPSTNCLIRIQGATIGIPSDISDTVFSIATPVISGTAKTAEGVNISEVTIYFSGGVSTATTDTNGKYSFTINGGWSGTCIPKKDGYYFTPSARSYGLVVSSQTDQDYIGTALTNDDMDQLRYHLNIIATTDGWVQSSVDKANSILSKTIYTASHWETFFTDYFLQNYFTDNLRNYIGGPIFWWFGNDVHLALQTGLINPLIQKIKNIMSSSSTNFGQVLENNSFLRQTIFNCHKYFINLANFGVVGDNIKNHVFDFCSSHITTDYPEIFKSSVTIDPNTQPYVPTLKSFVWGVLVDLSPTKNSEIETIIGLSGRIKKIWNDFSVLIIDNNGLDSVQLDFIYNYFSKIPVGLPFPRIITVGHFLGNTEGPQMSNDFKSGINIHYARVGEYSDNSFPADVSAKFTDSFSLIAAHEANHIVDAHYVYGKGNEKLKQRKEQLILRAGTNHMNYLRSMFDDRLFMDYPQEFIASIANQWFTDSAHTLELGIARFNNGYREPINQALFFADIYSLNKNKTVFYIIDTSANIEKYEVPIGRKNGNINMIVWDKKAYEFTLDDAGYVTGTNTKNGVAISGRIKNWEGAGLEGVTIAFSNNGGSITTDSNGYYTHVLNIGWSGTANPSKEGYTFVPPSRSYSDVTTNQASQDYTATIISPPQIVLSKTKLNFGAQSGGMATQSLSVVISNAGGGTLNWTAVPSAGWVAITPAYGTGAGMLSIGVNSSGLLSGTFSGSVVVTAVGATNSPQTITVNLRVYDGTNPSIGVVDTPTDGITGIEGSVPVTGWAVDDIEVVSVKIYRDPVGGEGAGPNGYVYIGDAVFVEGARPDVEQAYPTYPLNYRAGWGYMMLTNFLPNGGNGTFRIHAFATDKEGNTALLGSKTITCDNAHATLPFGAIDLPAQGGTASGSSYINYAWVLATKPECIPTGGSTITAWVDGLPLGHPSYGYYRVDIATLFPGFCNANAAIGYIPIDTTKYPNGVHTIVWSATDSAGVNNGFGSRYFTIQNTGSAIQAERIDFEVRAAEKREKELEQETIHSYPQFPVSVRRGFDIKALAEAVYPDEQGLIKVEIRELERLEIKFPSEDEGGSWRGFLRVGKELRPLPIGSSIDAAKGIFSWLLGAGFIGEYEIVFVNYGLSGARKVPVKITIRPRY